MLTKNEIKKAFLKSKNRIKDIIYTEYPEEEKNKDYYKAIVLVHFTRFSEQIDAVKKAKEEDIVYISEEVKKLIPIFIKSGW